ncbi:MAG: DUF4921 family protein [Euryarchaeota archaeon]|nr:DUF4921 family protein [Euryarchaeota archaeon]
MSEVRKHYFLEKYCIIAGERAKRPTDFVKESETEPKPKTCSFCPGNENLTPAATAVYRYEGKKLIIQKDEDNKRVKDWEVRCFPNLYPALPGHEIIADTPDHGKHPSDFADDEITLLMQVYSDRTTQHLENNDTEYVSLFRNYGRDAGASLSHPHTQLMPMPFVPPMIMQELTAIEEADRCPYCDIVKQESGRERVIIENDYWIVFAPYCSRLPFEMWMLPKKHVSSITSPDCLTSLGTTLRDTLLKLKTLLNNPAYNYMFFQIDNSSYHLNIRIEPKLSIAAGFEKNTDVYINTIPPEDAARSLSEIDAPIKI